MKKATIISVALILLGFLFEYFYLIAWMNGNIFLNLKFGILGVVCIIAGGLGLWIYGLAGNDDTNAGQ